MNFLIINRFNTLLKSFQMYLFKTVVCLPCDSHHQPNAVVQGPSPALDAENQTLPWIIVKEPDRKDCVVMNQGQGASKEKKKERHTDSLKYKVS